MAKIMSNAELTNNMANHEDRITKLEKESKSMAKVNINIETGKGMSPADLYVSIKNGDITLDDFCVIAGLDVSKVKESLNKIEEDGYIHNQKLDGRHVCAQMMRAMAYNPRGYHNGVDGYTEYVKSLSYHEQFRFTLAELGRVSKMEKQGDREFDVHKNFFTQDVVIALCEDYIGKLREHIAHLLKCEYKTKCRGRQYITLQKHIYPMKQYTLHEGDRVDIQLYGDKYRGRIVKVTWKGVEVSTSRGIFLVPESCVKLVRTPKSNMVFVEDIQEMVFEPLYDIIFHVKNAYYPSYTELYNYLFAFIKHMPIHFNVKERKYIGYRSYSVPYDKCNLWVDAYKKRGAYMTASNLIKSHRCKLRGYTTKETLAMLEDKAKTNHGWEILGFLREVMRDSNYTPQTFTDEMFAKYHC